MKPHADHYHIRVRGHLDERWADWFDGFEMQFSGEDTDLYGSVVDQAGLHGILSKIRDLGLMLLLVECVDCLEIEGRGCRKC